MAFNMKKKTTYNISIIYFSQINIYGANFL